MTRTLAALALVLSTTGCSQEPGLASFSNMQEGNVQARMSGDMPVVGAFDDDSKHGNLYAYDGFMDMDMHAVGDYGWAMVMVMVELDEDGNSVEGSDEVIGCSGPEEGDAEFDEPAEDSDIDVEKVEIDGEEMYEITVNATFANGETVTAHGFAQTDW